MATHVTFDLWSEWDVHRARTDFHIGMVEPRDSAQCSGRIVVTDLPGRGAKVVISGDVALFPSAALGRSKWLDLAIAPVAERLAVRLIKRNLSSLLNTIFAHAAAFTDDAA